MSAPPSILAYDSLVTVKNNAWLTYRDTGSVLVFVHGVLSDSRACWLNTKTNTFWPNMVANDKAFADSGVYLGGYYTAFDSANFGVADCARELLSALLVAEEHPAVLDNERIIFVCHSLGGIVTRYMIERWREKFLHKKMGLLLIGSPSIGSQYANNFESLITLLRHETGKQLAWKSEILVDLDRRFKDLQDQRLIPNLMGRELCEHRCPVYHRWLGPLLIWFPQVVPTDSAGRYFGDPRLLPMTTHSSAVKPDSEKHCSYRQLREFYADVQNRFPIQHWQAPANFQRSTDPYGRILSRTNAMRCARLCWDININEDGDAINETAFEGIQELHSGSERTYQLARIWVQSGQTSSEQKDENRSSPHILIEDQKISPREIVQRVRLEDGATFPMNLVLQSADYNVYSMDSEEFRRKQTARADNTDFLQKSIRWEQVDELIVTARFPWSMRLSRPPFVEAFQLFHGEEQDIEVFDEHLTAKVKGDFYYSRLLRAAILKIKNPALWTAYRISWQLDKPPANRRPSQAAIAVVHQHRQQLLSLREIFVPTATQPATEEKKKAIFEILARFGQFVVNEIRQRAAQITSSIDVDISAIEITLMAITLVGSTEYEALRMVAGTDVSQVYWDLTLPVGDGIAGRAAKRVEPRVYDGSLGDNLFNGAYVTVEGTKRHEWLLSIPLWEESCGRSPLGVINVGTCDKDCAVLLRTLDNVESVAKITSYALGEEFLLKLLKSLGQKAGK